MLPTRRAKRNQKPPNSRQAENTLACSLGQKPLPCQIFCRIFNKVLTLLLRHDPVVRHENPPLTATRKLYRFQAA